MKNQSIQIFLGLALLIIFVVYIRKSEGYRGPTRCLGRNTIRLNNVLYRNTGKRCSMGKRVKRAFAKVMWGRGDRLPKGGKLLFASKGSFQKNLLRAAKLGATTFLTRRRGLKRYGYFYAFKGARMVSRPNTYKSGTRGGRIRRIGGGRGGLALKRCRHKLAGTRRHYRNKVKKMQATCGSNAAAKPPAAGGGWGAAPAAKPPAAGGGWGAAPAAKPPAAGGGWGAAPAAGGAAAW